MKIRKFTAPSVPLALRQVHDDLGNRAVILNTRTLPAGGDPDVRVEITAALDAGAVTRQPAAPVAVADAAIGERPDLLGRVYGRSRPLATAAERPPTPSPRWQESEDSPPVGEGHIRSAAEWLASLPAVQRDNAQVSDPAASDRTETPATESQSSPPKEITPVVEGAGDSKVIGQLRQLEDAVHRMASQTGGFELPPELSRLGERLRRTGLSDVHVRNCLQATMRQLNNGELDDRDAIARGAVDFLQEQLPAAREIRIGRQRKVVAFVGPSGSGKTTAAARIAAGFVHRRQQRGIAPGGGDVVLISADSKRVGALAQATAFADLIRVPLETAYDELELAGCVDAHPEARLVIVDAGGCGPHERTEIEHQKRMFAAAGVDETHVVVDGLTGLDHILEAAKAWNSPTTRLLVTKMDQSVRPGAIVSAAIEAALPLSYLTISAAVPGGIRPGDLGPWIEWMVDRQPRPFTESAA